MVDVADMPGEVRNKFAAYPDHVQPKMLELRELALSCVGEPYIDAVQETLKWGEPSYLAKYGSTLRIDWKPRAPAQLAVYVHCQTNLIETIREVYGDLFTYDGKRAILLPLDQPLPRAQLKHCMCLALSYHKRKHLPLLGL